MTYVTLDHPTTEHLNRRNTIATSTHHALRVSKNVDPRNSSLTSNRLWAIIRPSSAG